MIYGGYGLGTHEGRKVFVPLTAPGDVVRVRVKEDKGQYLLAEVVKYVKAADGRLEPPCPVYGSCGGCHWQHLSYASQLLWKQAILEEQLKRLAKIPDPLVLPTVPSPKMWGYRSRIEVHVDKNGRVGFHKEGTNEVVEFEECLIAEEKINRMLSARREHLAKGKKHKVMLSLDDEAEGFTQVNRLQNDNLRSLLMELVESGAHKSILELYCGGGNFTFALSSVARRVVAVDSDERAIVAAAKRADAEGVKNITFMVGSAHEGVIECVKAKDHFDAVVIDPPRSGCREVIADLLKLRVKHIIYISCNPATLARDLRHLIDGGYALKQSQPVDMFPQTYHIESINYLVLE